jgi:eukaryotic-like serine/threonine-protein kinase
LSNDELNIAPEKFKLLKCLKKEGDYAVYYAQQIHPEKTILLKTFKLDAKNESIQLARLKREARLLAKLEHPNIVRVLDAGVSGEYFYISVEYFPNKNLRELMNEKQISLEIREKLFIQLMTAIAYIHSHTIIHRDIKPENILIGENNALKLADFGLSVNINDSSLTQHQSIVGTPAYMSPAQLRGEELSESTDLFSAGIVYYELIMNRNPFLGKDVVETVNSILNFGKPEKESLLKELSPAERTLIGKLLRVNSDEPYISAVEILESLHVDITTTSAIRRIFTRRKNLSLILYVLIFLILSESFYFINLLTSRYYKSHYQYPKTTILNIETPRIDTTSLAQQKLPGDTAKTADAQNQPLTKAAESLVADNQASIESGEGELMLETTPWVSIYSDSGFVDTTPIKKPIRAQAGNFTLRLRNPAYPDYTLQTHIRANKTTSMRINLDTLFGKVDCKILPWGDVYINGKFRAQSPLKSPILLLPGEYTVMIKHPDFQPTTQKIQVKKNEITIIKHNFFEK